MSQEKKLLINTPNIHDLGGVANHYKGLLPYWTCNVCYNSIGSQKWRKIQIPWTILKFIWKLIFFRPNMVLLNPSMGGGALKRDFFYSKLSLLFGTKVSFFIHGFNLDYAKNADWNWITNNLNKATHIIVLAEQFKQILIEHGVTTDIQLSTTKVPDDMIDGFDVSIRTGEIKNILFLARIEKAKGVYEAVDTFSILKSKHPQIKMKMVGDGSELAAIKRYVAEKQIQDVEFTGALFGEDIVEVYKNADMFFFFTTHGEGMPTVVLEAMAFGLPVITRYVGGLCDFFEDGKMGRITNSLNPYEFAELVEPLLQEEEQTKQISHFNHKYAKEHFLASKVAKGIENIIIK